ncbi:MAG: PfkB family carbohydrate kinase [Pseudomonadota bacterium]
MSERAFAIGGENLIDHVTRDGQVSAKVGGSPFNVAMGLGRLGANVSYVSPISTDPWGGKLAATLTACGVALTGGRVDLPTTMARVEVTNGHPRYRFEREGTAERAVDRDWITARIKDAGVVHTGSLTLTRGDDAKAWADALALAYARGQFVSVDPNVRMSVVEDAEVYRARIFAVCRTAHVIKLSDEDLSALFPGQPEAEAMAALRDLASAELIVLTKGAKGAAAFLGGTKVEIDAAPVPRLLDAVGAGDTFTATVLWALSAKGFLTPPKLKNLGPDLLREILMQASTAAAINCGREGCDPPTLAELDGALA